MRRDTIRWGWRAAFALAAVPLISGCGGGGSAGGTNLLGGGSNNPSTKKIQLTKFDVDVTTGKVKMSSVDSTGRAILAGGSVSYTPSDLLTVGGDAGKRHMTLTVQNNSKEGFAQGRLIVGNLSNSLTAFVKNSVTVSTSAGNGTAGHLDGFKTGATFQNAQGIALGQGPNAASYFISDSGNATIRQLFPDGTVRTFAGLAGTIGTTDGNGAAARFRSSGQLAVDNSGNVYVADTGNHAIRRITPLAEVSTIAGIPGTAGNHDDVSGNLATFNGPTGIAVTPDGNTIYVAESNDIRQITWNFSGARNLPTSYSTATVAGNASSGFVDGAGTNARFNKPFHLAYVQSGQFGAFSLFITDSGNNAIRAIASPNGFSNNVVTVSGGNGVGSTDGAGTVAKFSTPSGIDSVTTTQFGAIPSLFVSDKTTGLIRVINYVPGNGADERGNYKVTTLTSGTGFADGDGNVAKFSAPLGISAVGLPGPSATLEIVDQGNQRIRKLNTTSAGISSGGASVAVAEPVRLLNWETEVPNHGGPTVAWAKNISVFGQLQGAVDLQFYVPQGVSGFSFTAYIDGDTSLINLPAAGASYITTLAGNGTPGDSDGPGRLAQFNGPFGIAVGPRTLSAGFRAVVSDRGNHRIRLIDLNGGVTTLAGSIAGNIDGAANTARFNGPRGVAVTPDGSIIVADNGNRKIRKITFSQFPTTWTVTTIAGSGTNAVTDGTGAAAAFSDPTAVSVDAGGSIFVAEQKSNVIRKITYSSGDPTASTSYVVKTIAGAANVVGSTDGAGTAARFNGPQGIYADTDGMVYVTDTLNQTIRALSRTGVGTYSVTTIAGTAGSSGATDGNGAAARFNIPVGIAGDTAHNLYVCEFVNNRIRRISPLKQVVTIAGSAAGNTDGPNGLLKQPQAIAIEDQGTILVTDQGNQEIRTVQRLITDAQP